MASYRLSNRLVEIIGIVRYNGPKVGGLSINSARQAIYLLNRFKYVTA